MAAQALQQTIRHPMTSKKDTYKEICEQKRSQRDAKFIKEWLVPESELPGPEVMDVLQWIPKSGQLSKEELEITETAALEIVARIKAQTWTSLQVTRAFCHRASLAHQLVNCLTEVFFEDAFEQAGALDAYQREHNAVKGPLHGLPVSLKDNMNIKGYGTSLGIANFCINPPVMEEDAVVVRLLRELGAVFYAKTNVPVAMMMPETMNHVWGTTVNPFNRKLSSGGSSGGEAALIALHGSPVGVGSDIGGSIRIPATFQNLFAIRPTFGRFPTFGTRSALPGFESVYSVNGPLSTNLSSIELYCKSVIGQQPWLYDPKAVSIPWREVTLPQQLTFAVVLDDGVVKPTPPILRGLNLTVGKLRKQGHEVITWNTAEHLRLSELITYFFISDGGVNIKLECEATGEPPFPAFEGFEKLTEMGVATLWKLQNERSGLQKKYLDRWNATAKVTGNGKPIDAIILPAAPFPGNPHNKFRYVGYTTPYNLLDYTVGTFPVTRADKAVDIKEARSTFFNETDEKVWQDYDPAESHGGAVALQLVGRRFEEEKVIEMLGAVTKALSE